MTALREIAVLNQLDEFIDVIDNVEEDIEIAILTGPKLEGRMKSTLFDSESSNQIIASKVNSNGKYKDIVNKNTNNKKDNKSLSEGEKSSTCSIL